MQDTIFHLSCFKNLTVTLQSEPKVFSVIPASVEISDQKKILNSLYKVNIYNYELFINFCLDFETLAAIANHKSDEKLNEIVLHMWYRIQKRKNCKQLIPNETMYLGKLMLLNLAKNELNTDISKGISYDQIDEFLQYTAKITEELKQIKNLI